NHVERLRAMSEEQRDEAIEQLIADNYHAIVESDGFEREANRTSADCWVVEEHEVTGVDLGAEEVVVRLTFAASGDPPEDAFFDGARVGGGGERVIDRDGRVSVGVLRADASDGCEGE